MAGIRERGLLVRRYILEHVGSNSQHIVRSTAFEFGISRQAVNKHLSRLIKEGLLTAQGATRNRTYSLTTLGKQRIVLLNNAPAAEVKSEFDRLRKRVKAARPHNPR